MSSFGSDSKMEGDTALLRRSRVESTDSGSDVEVSCSGNEGSGSVSGNSSSHSSCNNSEGSGIEKLAEAVTPDEQRRFVLPATDDPYDLILTFNPRKYNTETWVALLCYLLAICVAVFVQSPLAMVVLTLLWRMVYNVGIGVGLYHQSKSLALTRWMKDLQKNPFSPTYQFVREILVSAIGEMHVQDHKLPADYYVWILTRNVIAIVESNDILCFTLCAIKYGINIRIYGMNEMDGTFKVNEEAQGLLNIVWDFMGVLLITLSLWGRVSAGRKAGEYAWYWGDFFFIRTQSTRITDGIFELFPHPMYTVGYCWIYGCALLARSTTILLLAMVMHISQLLFLWIVEYPHVDKLYGTNDLQVPQAYKSANIALLINFDFFRASDVNLVLTVLFMCMLYELGSQEGGPFDHDWMVITHFMFWRLLCFVFTSYVLLHQEQNKVWTDHFINRGYSRKEAFEHWVVLYNTFNTLKNVAYLLCARRFAYFPSVAELSVGYVVQIMSGIMLTILSLWATTACYAILGDYGWFYGDFFLSPVKLRPRSKRKVSQLSSPGSVSVKSEGSAVEKTQQEPLEIEPFPTYTGIYQYLNNPDTYIGHLWVFGIALVCSSQELFSIAFISYVIRIAFLNIVEKPHVRAVYKHRVRRSSTALGKKIRMKATDIQKSDSALFLSNWIKHPIETGALAPSSRQLAIEMCDTMGVKEGAVVIELGPGTGPFTEEILRRMNGKGHYIAFELSTDFIKLLQERFPENKDDFVCRSAEHIVDVLATRGLKPKDVDCVLSGLPWAIFSKDLQRRILEQVASVLKPGGKFATFAYLQGVILPAGQSFRALLGKVFGKVERSKIVWKNLPPAFVYRCTVTGEDQHFS